MKTDNIVRVVQMSVLDVREEKNRICRGPRLLYILEGVMKLQTGGNTCDLKPEDVLVLNVNEQYSFQASSNILFLEMELADILLEEVYDGYSSVFSCNSAVLENENYGKLRDLLKRLLLSDMMCSRDPVKNYYFHFEFASCYYQILELLLLYFLKKHSHTETGAMGKEQERMKNINIYIQKNYAKGINLQDLSRQLYLSEGYLSRYFRQNYGVTFSAYIKGVRLSHAMDDLLYTEKPITQIAYDNGFSSVSFFNRTFKEVFRKVPSQFRSQRRGGVQENGEYSSQQREAVNDRLDRLLDSGKKELSIGQEDVEYGLILTKVSKPFQPCWNELINVGSASDLLRSEIQEHVMLLEQALHFRYVRFWNLFSEEMLIDLNDELGRYNFSRLDRTFDFLISQGIKPFLDLESKPWRINSSLTSVIRTDNPSSVLNDIDRWAQFLNAFIQHILKRYGEEEVSGWRVEVPFEGYQIRNHSKLDSFLLIFHSTVKIWKHYLPEIKIGGPGSYPGMGKEDQEEALLFWDTFASLGVRPDFVSIMNYAYEVSETGDFYIRQSNDSQYLLHSIERLNQIFYKTGWSGIELYITEWNLTVSVRNYMNDTCFHGAYLVKNVIDTFGKADAIGYFNGSDRIAEYYDSNALLHGGTGLLTKDGIFKPTAFSIEFMNRLQPYFLGKGDYYIATTDRKNRFSILCHNMKNLGYIYYMTEENEIEKEKIERYFEDHNARTVKLELDQLEDGKYQAKTYRINNQSGSVLDIWRDMGYYSDLSRDEIKYFRKICEPRLMLQLYEVQNGRLSLDLVLEANEILLLELEKTT